MSDSLPAASARSRFLPVLAGLFAIGIFIIDTYVPLDIAIAVLYVVVVLIASNIYQRRGLLVAASACMALTLLSYFIVHKPEPGRHWRHDLPGTEKSISQCHAAGTRPAARSDA